MTGLNMPRWMARAACQDSDATLFFPPDAGGQKETKMARAICGVCPVKAECLDYAVTERIAYGIWGGLVPKERRKYNPGRGNRRGLALPIKHGTNGGSRAHSRRGETPCEECKRAHALYSQMLVEKKRQGT